MVLLQANLARAEQEPLTSHETPKLNSKTTVNKTLSQGLNLFHLNITNSFDQRNSMRNIQSRQRVNGVGIHPWGDEWCN